MTAWRLTRVESQQEAARRLASGARVECVDAWCVCVHDPRALAAVIRAASAAAAAVRGLDSLQHLKRVRKLRGAPAGEAAGCFAQVLVCRCDDADGEGPAGDAGARRRANRERLAASFIHGCLPHAGICGEKT